MRGRAGCALLALAIAFLSSPAARAFDRVQVSHSSDPSLLGGLPTPIDAEVRVSGPWQVQVPGSGSGPSQFAWQTGVPVPFSLVFDGDVAHFDFGDGIAYDLAVKKNPDFDSILIHAQAESAGYSMRVQQLVLNVSSAGIGGPLPDFALADGDHPDDTLLLRGVDLLRGFELHGQMLVALGTGPPPPNPQLLVELLVTDLAGKCPKNDRDCDGVPDAQDNCPTIANPDQATA
jgi:hypothetical protein